MFLIGAGPDPPQMRQKWELTCTMSFTSALSVLIFALCRPLMFSPIQVMSVNFARLLMESPVVRRMKPKRRTSSVGGGGFDSGQAGDRPHELTDLY